jgi:hypothetical protein
MECSQHTEDKQGAGALVGLVDWHDSPHVESSQFAWKRRPMHNTRMSIDWAKLSPGPELVEKLVDLCLQKPLYKILAQGDDAHELAEKLEETSFKFDAYCVGCKKEATFQRLLSGKKKPQMPPTTLGNHIVRYQEDKASLNQTLVATCSRGPHRYTFIFGPYLGGLAKIGQSPSMADIASGDVVRFTGVLEEQDVTELQQAIRLHTHGAAIGAFVYLRRIFERLLDRHYDDYIEQLGPTDDFAAMSIEDKVQLLDDFLPEEVVANRKVYAVLSKGIHALLEDECLLHYAVMYAAVVEILERDIYTRQRAKTSLELRNAVADVAGRVAGTKRATSKKRDSE